MHSKHKHELGEEDLTIMRALWERLGMTYQEIANLDGNRNRNRARQRLDELVKQELVEEEGRSDWRKGKKLAYSLTYRGRLEYFRSNSIRAIDKINILKEAIKGIDPVEALVVLGELRKYLQKLTAFVDDVYNSLPKNAEQVSSTETEDERKRREVFYKEAGGKIHLSSLSKGVRARFGLPNDS